MATVHGPELGKPSAGHHSSGDGHDRTADGETHGADHAVPGGMPADWNPYTGPYHHEDETPSASSPKGREGSDPGRHSSPYSGGDHGRAAHPHHHGADHAHGAAGDKTRGLRHRVRRRLHPFRSAIKGFAIGLTAGLLCLGAAWMTGVLDPEPILQALSGSADDPAAGVSDELGRDVITACASTLSRTDCRCFWGQTRAVWTRGNTAEVMQALTERNRYAGQLTRMKLDRLIGEDANRQVMQALIQCLE